MSDDYTWKIVRRYKKKLHQIAHLETVGRMLSPSEQLKVDAKEEIRSELQEVLENSNVKDVSCNATPLVNENVPTLNLSSRGMWKQKRSYFDGSGSAKDMPLSLTHHSKKHYEGKKELDPETVDAQETIKKPHVRIRKNWRRKAFAVTELLGHNGAICAVDVIGNWLISGSQDTSVKLWNLSTSKEQRNLSGHTAAVTCVKALDKVDSNKLYQSITLESNECYDIEKKFSKNERLLITASLDCSINLWLIPQGVQLKSIYNFSPVVSLTYCSSVIFAGSDNGKLTAYSISSGRQLCDTMIHDDKITALKVDENSLLSASFDGDLKLWKISNLEKDDDSDIKLQLQYSLINDANYSGQKPIFSACFYKDKIVFGDDGINLKVVHITKGLVLKYPNHIGSTGFTDSLHIFNEVLLSTSYNPVDGIGALNVCCADDQLSLVHVCSLSHPDIPRLQCCVSDKSHHIVTGGEKLLVWKSSSTSHTDLKSLEKNNRRIVVKGEYVTELDKTDVSSDVESDDSDIEEQSEFWWCRKSDENNCTLLSTSDSSSNTRASTSWSWWCVLV